MNLRPLGSTGLRVSHVGVGCWQLGGDGWGSVSSLDVQAAVLRALELGVHVLDTAPIYGFGQSEELLGRMLSARRGETIEATVVISKAGLVWDDQRRVRHDNRPESLRAQLEGTLRRLRRERLDVLLLHWPDPSVPLEESVAALDALRGEGKIRAWGLSNFPAGEVLRLARTDMVLEYPSNVLKTYAKEARVAALAGEELLASGAAGACGFIAYDVLARGLLGGRYSASTRFGKRDLRARDDRFSPESFSQNLESARRMPSAVAAIRGVLENPSVSCALVGIKTLAQAEEMGTVPFPM